MGLPSGGFRCLHTVSIDLSYSEVFGEHTSISRILCGVRVYLTVSSLLMSSSKSCSLLGVLSKLPLPSDELRFGMGCLIKSPDSLPIIPFILDDICEVLDPAVIGLPSRLLLVDVLPFGVKEVAEEGETRCTAALSVPVLTANGWDRESTDLRAEFMDWELRICDEEYDPFLRPSEP